MTDKEFQQQLTVLTELVLTFGIQFPVMVALVLKAVQQEPVLREFFYDMLRAVEETPKMASKAIN